MVHLLASLAFAFVAVTTLGLIALMLLQDQEKIKAALGLDAALNRQADRRPVRVRTAGRWQAAPASTARPWRAAA